PQRRVLAPRPRAAPHPEGRGSPRAAPVGAQRSADRRTPLRARRGLSPGAGDGGEPMPRAEAEIAIEAPIELVWRVMLDLGAYARWNPFIVRIDPPGAGPARVGDDLVLHVRWRSGLAVRTRERITRLEPPRAAGARRDATLEYEFRGPVAALGLVRGRRLQS